MEPEEAPLHITRSQLGALFLIILMLLYWLFFKAIYDKIDNGAFALIMIFPCSFGLLLGMRGGFASGILVAIFSLFLAYRVGLPLDKSMNVFITVAFIYMIFGAGLGRLRDLTIRVKRELLERRKVEEALEEARNKLEIRVKERTAELTKVNEELREEINERRRAEKEKKRLELQLLRAHKMEAVGTLAGGVAHDLNNVLSSLVGYPDLLLMEIGQDSPLRRSILTIKKSGEKAAAIVQDLLTLARRGVTVEETVNMNEIISEYLESPEFLKLKSYHSNVRIETDMNPNLQNIQGSPVHLLKTVMNLVSNAAEAIQDAGKILISTENVNLESPLIGYEQITEGEYVLVSVSDTGIGIPKEDIENIFEPFYTKKKMGRSGTGLGMTVVWGTVKDHRGFIDIHSTEGKGTTVYLYFPATGVNAKTNNFFEIEDFMGKGESVMVIDDVPEQREIATDMLKKLGYIVISCHSGEEAVDYLKDNSIDIVVIDMIMDPGIDGLETYKRIIEFHPGQKAIIVSGFSETERVREAKKSGVGQYVKKPYTLEEIGKA